MQSLCFLLQRKYLFLQKVFPVAESFRCIFCSFRWPGSYFNAVDLASVGHQLDEAERARMAEGGVDSAEYNQFIAVCTCSPSVKIIASSNHTWFGGRRNIWFWVLGLNLWCHSWPFSLTVLLGKQSILTFFFKPCIAWLEACQPMDKVLSTTLSPHHCSLSKSLFHM